MHEQAPSDTYTGPMSKREAFISLDTHPITLDLILLREFGTEYLGWEAETLWAEILRTWGTTTSDVNKNRIQAVRTCHVQRSPYREWEVFENVAAALNGIPPRFDLLQRPSVPHAAAALDMLSQIRDDAEIGDEVYRYCAAVMMDMGVAWGPGPLLPCNKHVEKLVGAALQTKVSAALQKGVTPAFDGSANDEDTQVMKSITAQDYVGLMSRLLVRQVNHLLPK